MPARITCYVCARIIRFAYAAAVRIRVVVETAAIFAQRTVHACAVNAFLRVGTADAFARLAAPAPRPVRFVTGRTDARIAAGNLHPRTTTSAVAVCFLARCITTAIASRRARLTGHVFALFTDAAGRRGATAAVLSFVQSGTGRRFARTRIGIAGIVRRITTAASVGNLISRTVALFAFLTVVTRSADTGLSRAAGSVVA